MPSALSPLDEHSLQRIADAIEQRRKPGHDWFRWAMGLALAAFLSYVTTVATMDKEISAVQEREENHFNEVLRRLELMQSDIRELRRSQ